MSFEAREKVRKQDRKISASSGSARSSGSAKGRYWLTVVSRKTCCALCAGILREGREVVYRHTPRESLCVSCAISAGVSYRPSTRWMKERRR